MPQVILCGVADTSPPLMNFRRLRLSAAACLSVLMAACAVPVRPVADEVPEPVTPVVVRPEPPVLPPPPPPPEEPAPPDPIDTGAEVFDRMVARFSPPVCVRGEHNRAWRRRYAGYPAGFARHVEEILPLMAYVLEEVERRDLPGEYVLIPIIESWYRPNAVGPGGPAGMWQMIASTARLHGIKVQNGYDGRLSPVEGTHAALDHLQRLGGMFEHEWRATAMGYNAGEYRILRAFAGGEQRVSGERRLPRGLSGTTYDYVAKMHALACLFAKPERHRLELPRDATFLPLTELELPPGIQSLDVAARTLGIEPATLRNLNPAYRQGRVVPGVPRVVLAPMTSQVALARSNPEAVWSAADASPSRAEAAPTGSGDGAGRVHRIARGDTLSRIAQHYAVPLRQLLELNSLELRSVLRVGQQLRIDP
ncbi:transglycosylase SLT domain-containing protein [Arenimonas composti]|uniref:LysM domain-containing protein n=1 Tax=Arenimonas composti TR7-09 = DSM 18010 TaxID=1121013 RepID=A0A091BFT9_9GAMM|nr:transglycosylase SLT domain-containing protein [Arenimonas composti]KFN50397.1 hypothetical protein P873_06965 [Arenimonas composti TR7-09 = DSM 18010]